MDERFRVYPWSMSSTGEWSEKTGLLLLKDMTVQELARVLWSTGSDIQKTAIIEIIDYGFPRKAAEFARELVKTHPVCERSIREDFGELASVFVGTRP